VPRAPLPAAGVTRDGAASRTASGDVTPPSKLVRAHAPVPPPLSAFVDLMRRVLAGCCHPLLVVGPSRHYPRNPCGGDWTHTPPCLPGAFTHFFPGGAGLTFRERRSAHGKTPAMRLRQGTVFRGCSHSLMFNLPRLLDPPVAPTAIARRHRAAGPFTPRIARRVTPAGMWHRYVTDLGNCHGWTRTSWIPVLSAAPSRVRFWPRLGTPFSGGRSSRAAEGSSDGTHPPPVGIVGRPPRSEAQVTAVPGSVSGAAWVVGTAECPGPLCLTGALPTPGRSLGPPRGTLLPLQSSYGPMRQSHHLSPLSVALCVESSQVAAIPCWS
jgi:hypothetical protein